MDISIVIPLYNEEKRLPFLIKSLNAFMRNNKRSFELILVNDGSSDNTLKLLEDYAESLKNRKFLSGVGIHSHETNQGKGAALKTGVINSQGDWVLTLDADMSASPQTLSEWQRNGHIDIDTLNPQAIYIGSRTHPESQISISPTRKMASIFFNVSTQLINGIYINDTQCGFKLYPGHIAHTLFNSLTEKGWAHDLELLKLCKGLGYAIRELPVTWVHKEDEKIHPIKDGIKMLGTSCYITGKYVIRKAPFNTIKWFPQKTDKAFALLIIFCLFLVFGLFLDFGMSWDEPIHIKHGQLLLQYYTSFFKDIEFIEKIPTYGGIFDITATILNPLLPWKTHENRHLLIALCGILGIIGTYKCGRVIAGKKCGFMAAMFLLLYPFYFGNMFFNPKDIPFAVGYIWSLYYILLALRYFPIIPYGITLKIGLAIGCTAGIRIIGLFLFSIFALGLLWQAIKLKSKKGYGWGFWLYNSCHPIIWSLCIAYLIILFAYPLSHSNPIAVPYKLAEQSSTFEWGGRTILDGEYVSKDKISNLYFITYLFLKTPLILFFMSAYSCILLMFQTILKKTLCISSWLLVCAITIPLSSAIILKITPHDTIRHILFLLPCICAFTASIIVPHINKIAQTHKFIKPAFLFLLLCGYLPVINQMVSLHPYQYIYYNASAPPYSKMQNTHELDYWATSYKEALELVHRKISNTNNPVYIYVTGPATMSTFYLNDKLRLTFDKDKATYFLSTTRGNMHKNIPGVPIIEIRRNGALLAIVTYRRLQHLEHHD